MACIAQPASTSMVVEVLQLMGGEEIAILMVTALLAVTFRGALVGKQTGSSKSLKLKPHHADKSGSFKSTETLKLEQGDVTLAQSVTHESYESGSQGACGEEPGQNSQQMPPTSSSGSEEELAEMPSRQGPRGERQRLARVALRNNASAVLSGDPMKDALVGKIKSLQSSRKEMWHAWAAFCESQPVNNRDPARYPVDVLQQFVRSSHPWNARK